VTLLQYLLENGADQLPQNDFGQTPPAIASLMNRPALIAIFENYERAQKAGL